MSFIDTPPVLNVTIEKTDYSIGYLFSTHSENWLNENQYQYNMNERSLSRSIWPKKKGKREMSPAVLRTGPYRFYFVSHDMHEPSHIHIDRDAFSAKFWLNPVALAYNIGFPAKELRKLEALTKEHQIELLEAWNEYFGT